MICPECNEDRKVADFMGKDKCYKCVYRIKLKMIEPKKKAIARCVICEKELFPPKKKYCSPECVDESLRVHNTNYWTRKISISPVVWN